jgi:hypothetical protein
MALSQVFMGYLDFNPFHDRAMVSTTPAGLPVITIAAIAPLESGSTAQPDRLLGTTMPWTSKPVSLL